MCSDHEILLGIKSMLHELGGPVGELENLLFCTGALPADRGAVRSLRFVGLGHEPNGDSHLNIYVEPLIAHLLSTSTAHVNSSIQDAIRSAPRITTGLVSNCLSVVPMYKSQRIPSHDLHKYHNICCENEP